MPVCGYRRSVAARSTILASEITPVPAQPGPTKSERQRADGSKRSVEGTEIPLVLAVTCPCG